MLHTVALREKGSQPEGEGRDESKARLGLRGSGGYRGHQVLFNRTPLIKKVRTIITPKLPQADRTVIWLGKAITS